MLLCHNTGQLFILILLGQEKNQSMVIFLKEFFFSEKPLASYLLMFGVLYFIVQVCCKLQKNVLRYTFDRFYDEILSAGKSEYGNHAEFLLEWYEQRERR